jgi:hypothetical protein
MSKLKKFVAAVLAVGGLSGTVIDSPLVGIQRAEAQSKRPAAQYTIKVVTTRYDAKGKYVGSSSHTTGTYNTYYEASKSANAMSGVFMQFGRKTVVKTSVQYK